MRCKGVSTETCGGPDRLDVYQLSSSGALGTTTITTSTYFSTTTVTVVSAPTSSTTGTSLKATARYLGHMTGDIHPTI
jgi:spore maturation protein SpmB